MLGINGGELLVLLVVAVVVVGPERLPAYAEQLATWTRTLRTMVTEARLRVGEELGPEAAGPDRASLDPRRYDPRRIVRDALTEEIEQVRVVASDDATTAAAASSARSAGVPGAGAAAPHREGLAPFDDEAT